MSRFSFVASSLCLVSMVLTAQPVLADTVLTGFGSPKEIAVNPVTNRTYVADQSAREIVVFEGTDFSTRRSISTGSVIPFAITVNPRTNEIWYLSFGSNQAWVIDGETETTETVPIGAGGLTGRIVANPVTNEIWVGRRDGVTVIDGEDRSFQTISLPLSLYDLALDPVRNRVWFHRGTTTIVVIDGVTLATQSISTSPFEPSEIAIDPVRDLVYATSFTQDDLLIIDGSDLSTTTVPVGTAPNYVAVNPVTNEIWVTSEGGDEVRVVDGATLATRTIAVGSTPGDTILDTSRNRAYVPATTSIDVIDGTDDSVESFVVPATPYRGAVNPVTGRAWISLDGASSVATLGGFDPTLVTNPPFSDGVRFHFDEVRNRLFVAENPSLAPPTGITIVDLEDDSTQFIAFTEPIDGIAVDPFRNRLYMPVNRPGNDHLAVFDLDTNGYTPLTTPGPGDTIAEISRDRVWVVTGNSGRLRVVDGETLTWTLIDVFDRVEALLHDPGLDRFYAFDDIGGSLIPIEADDLSVGATIEVGQMTGASGGRGFALNPRTHDFFLASSNRIARYNLADGSVQFTGFPLLLVATTMMGYNPVTNKAYMVGPGVAPDEWSIVEIDGSDLTQQRTFNLGEDRGFELHNRVVVDEVRNRVYVETNRHGTELLVFDPAEATWEWLEVGISPFRTTVHRSTGDLCMMSFNSGFDAVCVEPRELDGGLDVSVEAFGGARSFADRTELRFEDTTTVWAGADRVWFQVDTMSGEWTPVDLVNGVGVGETAPLEEGYHTVYAFAGDGQEAASTSPGRSMNLGRIRSYTFRVDTACGGGTIGDAVGTPTDVLFVNAGAPGNPGTRHVEVQPGDSITASIVKPPSGGNGKFVVHANLAAPGIETQAALPAKLGTFCFPLLFSQGGAPAAVWNNIGKENQVGASQYFDGSPIADPPRAPADFLALPTGDPAELPVGTTVTFQGVILDLDSLSPKRASTTNAVVLEVLP